MPIEILIKSFLRPECVMRLVNSIRQFYPHIVIRICDDGYLEYCPSAIIYKLPFYSGLAVGKNYLISLCETPYFVLCDDDFIFTKYTDLKKMLAVISSANDIAVVGGQISNKKGSIKLGYGHIEVSYNEKQGRVLTRYYYGKNAPSEMINGINCISCRMLSSFIMGSKEVWKKNNIKWRDELKRADHIPFYLDLPLNVKCYSIPDIIIDHRHNTNSAYDKYREDKIYHRMVGERITNYRTIYEDINKMTLP